MPSALALCEAVAVSESEHGETVYITEEDLRELSADHIAALDDALDQPIGALERLSEELLLTTAALRRGVETG